MKSPASPATKRARTKITKIFNSLKTVDLAEIDAQIAALQANIDSLKNFRDITASLQNAKQTQIENSRVIPSPLKPTPPLPLLERCHQYLDSAGPSSMPALLSYLGTSNPEHINELLSQDARFVYIKRLGKWSVAR